MEVLAPVATVNGHRAAAGDPIPEGGTLATSDSGVTTFSLKEKFSDCQLQADSAVKVAADPDTPLSFEKGTALCSTRAGGAGTVELGLPSGSILLEDPIFLVSVQPGGSLVAVDKGFVQLKGGEAPGQTRLLGPGEQSSLTSGTTVPGPTQPFGSGGLDAAARQGIERMRSALPAPNFGFPDPGASPGLARIRRAAAMVVGVDASASQSVRGFVISYFQFVKEHWAVDVRISSLPPAQAGGALQSERVDAVVSPDSLRDTRAFPFFGEPAGRPWSLFVRAGDPGLEAGLRNLAAAAMGSGEYGSRYQVAFGRPASYEPVQQLVFPSAGTPRDSRSAAPGPLPTPSLRSEARPPMPSPSSFPTEVPTAEPSASGPANPSSPPGVSPSPGRPRPVTVIPAPRSVLNSNVADSPAGATNDHQQAFAEAQGVVLSTALEVDNGTIAAGTVVDSHMIFLNVPDGAPEAVDFNRTWTFARPVIGVMSDSEGRLEALSSGVLKAPGTTYPAAGFPARGLDLPPGSADRGAGGVKGEGYTVNGNTITVGMAVVQPGDWIRILTRGQSPARPQRFDHDPSVKRISSVIPNVPSALARGSCGRKAGCTRR